MPIEDDWPLRLGFLAGRRGQPSDPHADPDWQRGWATGNRQRLAKMNARQRLCRLQKALREGRAIRPWIRRKKKQTEQGSPHEQQPDSR